MLSDKYLAALPAALVLLYSQAEEDILSDMARKIAAANFYLSSAQWQHERLQLLGMTSREILRRLSALTQKTQRELRALIRDASAQTLLSDGLISRDEQGEIKLPKSVQAVVQAGLSRTSGTFENLTRTTAKTAAKQFENALDRAYMQVTTGAFSTDAAIRQAVKDLSAQGVASIRYPSGRVDTLETAVRRAVVTGVNQTAIQAALERAKELGAELMELKAHQGARPSHAAWQGKIVRVAGEPEAGESYLSLSDIGYGTGAGFGGWNCHHSWSPYWPGTARTWTDEQLEALKEPSVTYDGKPMTDYEASQQQRYFERQQRRWKREYKAMEAAGQDTYEAAAKIREWQEKEKDFLRQTGRKADADRATVAQFSWQDGKNAKKEAEENYLSWAKSIGVSDSVKNLAEYYDLKYNDPERFQLLQTYAHDVEDGWISPNAGFGNYLHQYDRIQTEIVGQTAANGIQITGLSKHFMQRVLGTAHDPGHEGRVRSGVEVDDIIDALQNPLETGERKIMNNGKPSIVFQGRKCRVSVNPDEGILIQTTPKGGRA